MTIAFGLSTAFRAGHSWLAWVQATAVASMVGGLADWFAVTALFRRPLGLPIPHTAIIVERKDRFAETLGTFVQESFLSPEAVITRLRTARALERASAWLAAPGHAETAAARIAEALSSGADLLGDAEAQDIVGALVRERVDRVALAPLAGRTLERATRDGRHQPVIDAGLEALSRYIRVHGAELHQRLGVRSPWWLPGVLSTRLVDRLLARTEVVSYEMARDRDHPIRRQLELGLEDLARRLQEDPEMLRRGEELKAEVLSEPALRRFAAGIWEETKRNLKEGAADPDSDLRRRLAQAVRDGGERLGRDESVTAAANRSMEAAVRLLLTNFADELVGLVTGTISRWDATDTARRLELLLGPDLQYIRINGTVVGALAGLALHAISVAAG